MPGETIPGQRKTRMGTSRPKITDLIRDGKLKSTDINDTTGLPITPESPLEVSPYTGTMVSRGYVRNPENARWRIGLTPEKYLSKIIAELDFELRKGRREKVAPDLYLEEVEDFLPWLDKYVTSDPVEGVPEHPTIRRYLREIERRKPKGKGKASPAPDAAV